ncbi:MAG: hypothetical protein LH478_08760 [Chitinophagaceae bacterium]|nr:hypothetical protein [Chitinophagaceae bacterium]
MKKLLTAIAMVGAIACQNPEDKANINSDTTIEYQEGRTLNSPPGVNSPDTSRMPKMDSTMK